jgi:hypothetical protein
MKVYIIHSYGKRLQISAEETPFPNGIHISFGLQAAADSPTRLAPLQAAVSKLLLYCGSFKM